MLDRTRSESPGPLENTHGSSPESRHPDTDITKRLHEFTRRNATDQGDSKAIRDFYAIKGIKPLSDQEKSAKTDAFNGRYKGHATLVEEGVYKVDITLKNGGGENIYTNSVDFNRRDILGEYNFANLDVEGNVLKPNGPRDPNSMNLSDIKWQTLRLAARKFSEDHPTRQQETDINSFRPNIISGHDIEEHNLHQTLFTNEAGLKLSRNQTYTFAKDTAEFDKLMKTTQGKSNLFLIGNYFSDKTVSKVTIDTGTGKYIKKVEYHLVDKNPAVIHTAARNREFLPFE